MNPHPGRRALLGAALALAAAPAAEACSRAVYLGPEGQVMTGRTMDWLEDMESDLWLFPRGMRRDGAAGPASLTWTSRHGSVITSGYGAGTTDGMNERGLVANLLFLTSTEYPPAAGDTRPTLAVSAWGQYVLDSFATVAEAVAAMRAEAFRLVVVRTPNGLEATVHLSISDASGDSAIIQCLGGRLVIHHGRQFQVMTNDPPFDQQLALNAYWERRGGTVMLPGTNRADDRFVRASFYINAVRQTADPIEAAAAVLSVMRNVSVPRGITTPNQPNISSTIWLTVSDHKNLIYYFQDTASPGLVWVRLRELDFAPGAGVRKLALHGQKLLTGDQTSAFRPAEAFAFLPA